MTRQEQLLVEAARRGLLPPKPAEQPKGPMTLQERSKDIFGFEDYAKRGTLLPFGITKEGETEFATPQVLKDLAESFLLPGHVVKGGSYTPQDVTKFALDYAVPLTAHPLVAKNAVTKRGLIKSAPSTEQLKAFGGGQLESAKASGVKLTGDAFVNFAADLEKSLDKQIAPKLHDTLISVMNQIGKRVGDELDIADLMIVRRQLGVAAKSAIDDERRLASMAIDALDDMVKNLTPDDLVGGADNAAQAGMKLSQGRTLWSRGKKSQLIEEAIEKAGQQASGFENGIRIQFRQILNNPKKLRGFSKDEVKAMKQVVEGTPSIKAMRLLAKLSPHKSGATSLTGGALGIGGGAYLGSTLGGPIGGTLGAIGLPLAGELGQRGAAYGTKTGADLVRAMAATGMKPTGGGMLSEYLMKSLGPVLGAQGEQGGLAELMP